MQTKMIATALAVVTLALIATPNAFASRFHVKHHIRNGMHYARMKMNHGHMHMHNLIHHGHM